MSIVSDAAASVVAMPSSVYAHSSTRPGPVGRAATGIEKFPAASAVSRWRRTRTVPPVVANCTASQASAGHVCVTDGLSTSRLNQ
jgi:hypothetical protein